MTERIYWRWLRGVALQESNALRAYARAGDRMPTVAETDKWTGFMSGPPRRDGI